MPAEGDLPSGTFLLLQQTSLPTVTILLYLCRDRKTPRIARRNTIYQNSSLVMHDRNLVRGQHYLGVIIYFNKRKCETVSCHSKYRGVMEAEFFFLPVNNACYQNIDELAPCKQTQKVKPNLHRPDIGRSHQKNSPPS